MGASQVPDSSGERFPEASSEPPTRSQHVPAVVDSADASVRSTVAASTASTHTQAEVEIAYRAPEGWVAPPAGDGFEVRPGESFEQAATYLDTPDLCLLRRTITLRRRVGGVDDGWHLKVPAGASAGAGGGGLASAGTGTTRSEAPDAVNRRIEKHAPLGPGVGRVPAQLRAELADILGAELDGNPLVPIATLTTVRTRADVVSVGPEGEQRVVAEIADDRVSPRVHLRVQLRADVRASGGADVATRAFEPAPWREIEVEAVPDVSGAVDEAAFARVRAWLEASGLTVADHQSKLGLVFADQLAASSPAGEPAESAESVAVAQDGTAPAEPDGDDAGEVVRTFVAAQLAVIQEREDGVRNDRPGAVHKSRVATRRLRSALTAFGALFDMDDDHARRIIPGAKKHARILGAARDAEVLSARLEAMAESGQRVPDRLTVELQRRGRDARDRVLTVLESPEYDDFLAALGRFVADPPPARRHPVDSAGQAGAAGRAEPAGSVLGALVAAQFERVARAGREAGAIAAREGEESPAYDEAMHDVRKLAKAARYAVEAAGDAVPAQVSDSLAYWEQVQEVLGEHQDAAVMSELVGQVRSQAEEAGEDLAPYDDLLAVERERARASRVAYGTLAAHAPAAS